MTKTLIIAEKPSVANDIARSLGNFTKKDNYFESDDYVLASAAGHLLEIVAPDEYEVKRGKWTFNHLPVIPPKFALKPISKTISRLKLLTELIHRKDIRILVNACDAGREGELIFRLIAEYTKSKQLIKRLWLQSMTPVAIREGFKHLRTDEEMLPLAEAARSRAEADWLVGINSTRTMTAFNSQNGGFFLTTVGRVQTPTLSIVVEREKQIQNFVPRNYWEVHATFRCAGGTYDGRWLDTTFKKDASDPEKRAERLWSPEAANKIVSACIGQQGIVTERSRSATTPPPLLFDLTSLQREANTRFGFSAKRTLDIAQRLYDTHKALTYPRTDSRHLPEDYLQTCQQTIETLTSNTTFKPFAEQVLINHWIRPNKRIFDNRKISDHFAIIPTLQPLKNQLKGNKWTEDDRKLYDLVVRRFLAVFFPAAEFQVTTRYTDIAGHRFISNGRIMKKPGWKAIHGKEAASPNNTDERTLIPVKDNENVLAEQVKVDALVTKPPARYTEATLLSVMEGAGKLVDDDLREAMQDKGLGTPATRASIIEKLLEEYLERKGKELIPTPKAFQLMTLLNGLGIQELTSPELTGEWEFRLAQMEKGNLSREEFMQHIIFMTENIVNKAKIYDGNTVPGDYAVLKAPCPQCGGQIQENYHRFTCTKCRFSITKTPAGRMFSIPEAEELLTNRQIGPLKGFRSKKKFTFAAILKIVENPETGCLQMTFDFDQPKEGEMEALDFTDKTPIGICPKCRGNVYDTGKAYVCEHCTNKDKSCSFRIGRIILQQEIIPEQMSKLLSKGKTELLTGFISIRKKRPFKAYLKLGRNGKIDFEFEKPTDKAVSRKSSATTTDTTMRSATKKSTSTTVKARRA